jgi:hypothetical protein
MALKRTLLLLLAAAALAAPALGQQTNLPPTQLALEVQFYPNVAPGYQTVSPDKRGGAWWGRFARVPGWEQPVEWPAVTAVNIKSELAEGGVRVWVSVFLGELHEQEKSIASYVLQERQKQLVRELADVGVQPFEIRLVRVDFTATAPPEFTSKGKSIELVALQPVLSTFPSFDVVVRNVSSKNVMALRETVFQSGRPQITSMPQGKDGRVLIPPGGTYAFNAHLAARTMPTADGYTPVVLSNQVVEVSSVVFDDGTFEGDSEAAAAFAGYQSAQKAQLRQVLALLSLTESGEDAPDAKLNQLRQALTVLRIEPSLKAIQELHARFPTFEERRLKIAIGAEMKWVRDDALNDVLQFQLHNRRVDAAGLRDWLKITKDRYQAWLSRL